MDSPFKFSQVRVIVSYILRSMVSYVHSIELQDSMPKVREHMIAEILEQKLF